MEYRFHDFTLNIARRELWRGDHLIAEPKVFQVLRYLLEHRDRVIPKDELLEQCWPGTFVSESALTRCLNRLRRALAGNYGARQMIKTLHRQGYRFTAEVTVLAHEPVAGTVNAECATAVPHALMPSSTSLLAPIDTVAEPTPRQSIFDASAATTQPSPPAERRQLTVIFCDVVDSTTLAGQLDPEEFREVILRYQVTCAKVIQRYEGHIAQYLGDGLLVYFGYPQAHEDDAQRAVHAGLDILTAIEKLCHQLRQDYRIHLAVRIGIHSGLVVIGEMGGGPQHGPLASGVTPNLTAKIQGRTESNTVVISASTHHLVHGYFACRSLGAHALPGVSAPLPLYQVLHASGAQGRLDVATSKGLTPFIGRDREVNTLLTCWQQVRNGSGHAVVLSGEAGIGKSRLLQALTTHLAQEPHTLLESRCSTYHRQSPWYPIIGLLRHVLDWDQCMTSEDKIRVLERWTKQVRLDPMETVPLFAALLGLSLPQDKYPRPALSPQQQRQTILQALLTYVMTLAEQQPLLLIVEDLHWCDPTTLEWLAYLIDQGPVVPLLLCVTCRPSFEPPWGWRAHMTPLIVDHLPVDQTANMVHQLTAGKSLPPAVLDYLVTTTNGVPLFVEEMTRMLLDSGLLYEVNGQYECTASLTTLTIPNTLQDLLMARLDWLGASKRTVQLGAVVGRQFPYALLQAVSPLDAETLQQDLERLVKAELLYQRGLPPHATYIFKHALIQEVAYQALLKRTRQHHHAQIAQTLTERLHDLVEVQPELVAHHYTEAGLSKEAIPYWQRAGQRAIERSALVEVVAHLTRGLAVLSTLPDTPERARQELTLLTTLGPTLIATKGHTSAEVEQVYIRARVLCEEVGDDSQRFLVLNGLRRLYYMRGQIQQSQECGEQLLAVAKRLEHPAQLMEAHLALAQLLGLQGQLRSARAQYEQCLACYDPIRHRETPELYPRDTAVAAHVNFGQLLSLLGYPKQAREWLAQAITLAQELAHPFSQAFSLVFAAEIHLRYGENQRALEQVDAGLELCAEHRFALFTALGTLFRGMALIEQGQRHAGMQLMREGLKALRTMQTERVLINALVRMGQACLELGYVEEGLTHVTEALMFVEKTGTRDREAELYRLKGELLLVQSVPNAHQAALCFQRALDIAHRQHAKSLELRATTSLARLWQHQGRREEAHTLLAPVYNWFTEGFDTTDLREAHTLLTELSSRC